MRDSNLSAVQSRSYWMRGVCRVARDSRFSFVLLRSCRPKDSKPFILPSVFTPGSEEIRSGPDHFSVWRRIESGIHLGRVGRRGEPLRSGLTGGGEEKSTRRMSI